MSDELVNRVHNAKCHLNALLNNGGRTIYGDWLQDLIGLLPKMTDRIAALEDEVARLRAGAGFQQRVHPWMLACFGAEISADVVERNHRFLEEALELVQSLGCPVEDARALVEYVYSREVGDPPQEVGGVMVTLAALCLASDMDMAECGETELARIWTKVEKIRAKQAAKPKGSALPQEWKAPAPAPAPDVREAAIPECCVGDRVEYRDHQGRLQTGKVQFIEAKWHGPTAEPHITYQVSHPTYANKRHYTGLVRAITSDTEGRDV